MIGLAGEQRPGFELGYVALRGRQLAVEVFQKIVALRGVSFFTCEANVRLDVAGDGSELVVRGNLFFRAFAIAENGLCCFLIVPEFRVSDAGFERFQAFAVLRRVKESSGRAKCVAGGLRNGIVGLRES